MSIQCLPPRFASSHETEGGPGWFETRSSHGGHSHLTPASSPSGCLAEHPRRRVDAAGESAENNFSEPGRKPRLAETAIALDEPHWKVIHSEPVRHLGR